MVYHVVMIIKISPSCSDVSIHRISNITSLHADIFEASKVDANYIRLLKKKLHELKKLHLSIKGGLLYYDNDRIYLPDDAQLRTRIIT